MRVVLSSVCRPAGWATRTPYYPVQGVFAQIDYTSNNAALQCGGCGILADSLEIKCWSEILNAVLISNVGGFPPTLRLANLWTSSAMSTCASESAPMARLR